MNTLQPEEKETDPFWSIHVKDKDNNILPPSYIQPEWEMDADLSF